MSSSEASSSAPSRILPAIVDPYDGCTIDESCLPSSPDDFERILSDSLTEWRRLRRRGVWLKIPIHLSPLIPVAVRNGFVFHDAQHDFVRMTHWLPVDEENRLPRFGGAQIGVSAVVIRNEDDPANAEVLVVTERRSRRPNPKGIDMWKLPSGLMEEKEEIMETAVRETFEETGIRTEGDCVLCFRHFIDFSFGHDDFLFVCLLRPLSTEITADPKEISKCRWMRVEEFQSLDTATPLMMVFAKRLWAMLNVSGGLTAAKRLRGEKFRTGYGSKTSMLYSIE